MKYNKHTSDRQQTVEGILSWCRLLQGTADKVAIYKAFQKCLPGGDLRFDLLAIGCVDDPWASGMVDCSSTLYDPAGGRA